MSSDPRRPSSPPRPTSRWRRADQTLTRDVLLIIFGVSTLVVVALFVGEFDWPRPAPDPGPPAPRPSRTTAKVARFGTAVVLRDSFGSELRIKPVKARWSATPGWASSVGASHAFTVRLELANRGGATIRNDVRAACWLVDDDGVEWPLEAADIGGETDVIELPGGKRCSGRICFAPPPGTRIAKLVYWPSSTAGDDYAVWEMK